MLASIPASMVNQKLADLGIPNRFNLSSSRFRGGRGDLIKIIWHDGQGACLFTKRLERGRFLWRPLADGVVTISVAQLSYLLSGIDWGMPQATWPASPPRPPKGHIDLRSEHQSSIRVIINRYFRFAMSVFGGELPQIVSRLLSTLSRPAACTANTKAADTGQRRWRAPPRSRWSATSRSATSRSPRATSAPRR